jgi:hypothetical protein
MNDHYIPNSDTAAHRDPKLIGLNERLVSRAAKAFSGFTVVFIHAYLK